MSIIAQPLRGALLFGALWVSLGVASISTSGQAAPVLSVDPFGASAALEQPAFDEREAQRRSALLDQAMPELALFSPRLLLEFYAQRQFQHAWSVPQAEAMLALAETSVTHGLAPKDFNAEAIQTVLAEARLEPSAAQDTLARWRADLLLSDALLRYLHHLQYGKHNPKRIDPDWTFVDSIDAAALQDEMHHILAAADFSAAVAAVLPHAPFYEELRQGYTRYRAFDERLREQGGWTPIPAGNNLRIGMRDGRLPQIRERLALLEGHEVPPVAEPDIYDRALYETLLAFQARSGLARDGVIGPRTLAALNHPLDERLVVIRANLERMRWLYHALPADYLLVDIAAYQLALVRDHQPVWSTRAVVGTDQTQTPMFRDEIEHLVFNPTWSVPRSIQQRMRGVSRDYRVIDRRSGRRVYPTNPTNHQRYRLVQEPGPKNALGRVKFMFPNGHAIYLHDTPSRHLFKHNRRAYSHGCVRVEEPLQLAQQLLDDPTWDASAIERVLARGRTRYVHLDEHLPILLYYLTARADATGRIAFRDDIYQRDRPLLAALEDPPDSERIVFSEPPSPASAPHHKRDDAMLVGEEPAQRERSARGPTVPNHRYHGCAISNRGARCCYSPFFWGSSSISPSRSSFEPSTPSSPMNGRC